MTHALHALAAYLATFGLNLAVALCFAAPFLAVIGGVWAVWRRELAALEADAAHVADQQGRGHA